MVREQALLCRTQRLQADLLTFQVAEIIPWMHLSCYRGTVSDWGDPVDAGQYFPVAFDGFCTVLNVTAILG